jgi:hypothetical protein
MTSPLRPSSCSTILARATSALRAQAGRAEMTTAPGVRSSDHSCDDHPKREPCAQLLYIVHCACVYRVARGNARVVVGINCMTLTTRGDGPRIVEPNYWDAPHAHAARARQRIAAFITRNSSRAI